MGVPFRGVPPLMGKKEAAKSIAVVGDQHVKMFDLADPKDLEYYTWVVERCRTGLFHLNERLLQYDQETKHYRVHLEWTQVYAQLPREGISNGGSAHVLR